MIDVIQLVFIRPMHADCSAPVHVDASVRVRVCVHAWCLCVCLMVGSKITIDLRVYPRT